MAVPIPLCAVTVTLALPASIPVILRSELPIEAATTVSSDDATVYHSARVNRLATLIVFLLPLAAV